MYELSSVPTQNGGYVTSWGEYTSVRDCTMAARAIKLAQPKREMYFRARNPEEHFTRTIALAPGDYQQDTEIVLSDGRIVWLGDVDSVLRDHLGPLPKRNPEYERESY